MSRLARPFSRNPAGLLAARDRRLPGPRAAALGALLLATGAERLEAQIKSPAERIEDLEKKIDALEDQVRDLEKEQAAAKEKAADGKVREEQDLFAGGLVTPGNIRIRLGGKAEFL